MRGWGEEKGARKEGHPEELTLPTRGPPRGLVSSKAENMFPSSFELKSIIEARQCGGTRMSWFGNRLDLLLAG